jgi:outer membrane protein assembly factor BamB
VCLAAATGEERWRVDFVARHDSPLPQFGLVCSPLIVGDALYVQAGASLTKLDRRTGETLWRSLEGQGGGMDSAFSSPILATLAGREQLVVQSRTHLSGVDPETGSVLWSQAVPAFRGMNILTPLVHGDAVFTSAYGSRGFLYGVRASAPDTSDAPSPAFTVTETWTSRAQGYMTSPVLVNGHAYLFLRSNRFTCVDLTTGKDRYISGPTGDEYWSLVTQSTRILSLADTGKLRLIEANPAAYTVLGELDIVPGPSWAHLAVTSPMATDATPPTVGADLFIRSQTALHAFHWR